MSLESDLAFIEEHRASLDGAQEERLYKDGVRMRNFLTGKGFGWLDGIMDWVGNGVLMLAVNFVSLFL